MREVGLATAWPNVMEIIIGTGGIPNLIIDYADSVTVGDIDITRTPTL